ncbi:hypothetical protein VTO73DRAFT_11006 [Trametes versicolor]
MRDNRDRHEHNTDPSKSIARGSERRTVVYIGVARYEYNTSNTWTADGDWGTLYTCIRLMRGNRGGAHKSKAQA